VPRSLAAASGLDRGSADRRRRTIDIPVAWLTHLQQGSEFYPISSGRPGDGPGFGRVARGSGIAAMIEFTMRATLRGCHDALPLKPFSAGAARTGRR
jgi:hypothetical protein